MNEKTAQSIGAFIGTTIGIFASWMTKALVIWLVAPSVITSWLPNAGINGTPGFWECFLLVFIVSQLAPVKTLGVTTPMLVKNHDDQD